MYAIYAYIGPPWSHGASGNRIKIATECDRRRRKAHPECFTQLFTTFRTASGSGTRLATCSPRAKGNTHHRQAASVVRFSKSWFPFQEEDLNPTTCWHVGALSESHLVTQRTRRQRPRCPHRALPSLAASPGRSEPG